MMAVGNLSNDFFHHVSLFNKSSKKARTSKSVSAYKAKGCMDAVKRALMVVLF